MTTPSRPLLRYHGSKWKIADWVISFFPPHLIYVEPYGGGAAVLVRKPRAPSEIYNDLDQGVVNLFRVLRDPERAAELARRLELTPFAREEYENWCYEQPVDDIDRAHRLVTRSFMGQSSKGIWERSGFDTRINPDGFCSRLNAFRATPHTVRQYVDRLRGVVIENSDALDLIRRHDRTDTLFYIDPPYVEDTRSSSIYEHDYTDADHRALAEVLHAVQGMVVLSGYASDLYDRELFSAWQRHEKSAHTDGARRRTEVVWLNPACAQHQNRLFT